MSHPWLRKGTSYCNRRMNSSEEWSWVWLEFIKEFRDSSKKNSWKQSAMMRNPSVSLELIRHWSSTLSQGESPSVLNRQTDLETFDSSLGRASFEIHSLKFPPPGTHWDETLEISESLRSVKSLDSWEPLKDRWKITEKSPKLLEPLKITENHFGRRSRCLQISQCSNRCWQNDFVGL